MVNEKMTCWIGENTWKYDKGLISKIYKWLIQLDTTKKATWLQNRQNLTDAFSKEDIQMVNRHMKRSLPLLIIREMQIQTPYLSEWLSSKSLQGTNVGEDVKKWETLCPVGGNVSWYSHYGKKACRVLKKTKNRTIDCTPGYIYKENKSTDSKSYVEL